MERFSGKISASIGSSKEITHLNKKKKYYYDDDDTKFFAFGRFLAWRTDCTYEPVEHLYS